VPTGRMVNNELERIWKVAGVAYFVMLLRHLPGRN
jgi:hypothetical protein